MTQAVFEKMDMTEAMLDGWRKNLEAMGWARDQGQKVLQAWTEQGRLTQAEAARMMERGVELATRQQEEMQKYIDTTMRMSLAAFGVPTTAQVDGLTAKVEALQAEVAALHARLNA